VEDGGCVIYKSDNKRITAFKLNLSDMYTGWKIKDMLRQYGR